MILVGKTCLKRISANCCLFSGFNSVGMVPSGSLAKASLVGAKTVKSPFPLRVGAKPAAFTAAKRVERAGVAAAVSAMDFKAGARLLLAPPLDLLHIQPGDLPHLHPPGAAVAMAANAH